MKEFKVYIYTDYSKTELEDEFIIDAENLEEAIENASNLDGVVEDRISVEEI